MCSSLDEDDVLLALDIINNNRTEFTVTKYIVYYLVSCLNSKINNESKHFIPLFNAYGYNELLQECPFFTSWSINVIENISWSVTARSIIDEGIDEGIKIIQQLCPIKIEQLTTYFNKYNIQYKQTIS